MTSDDRNSDPLITAYGSRTRQPVESMVPVAVAVEELDAGTLKALELSRMDPRHDALDALMGRHLID